jgi:hypothetical protein
MATQVRCPNCEHVFAASEVRYLSPSASSRLIVVLVLLVALLIWAVH